VTVPSDTPDLAPIVRALCDANVQFVVVGEVAEGRPLRIVVSRHPTNLEALGRALDGLGATARLRRPDEPDAGRDGERRDGPRRVGDPAGTVEISTSAGEVDLLFGGPRLSLYAEALALAEERELGGVRVRWAAEVEGTSPGSPVTSRMLGRRLLSLAEGIVHLMGRQRAEADGGAVGGDEAGDAEDAELESGA
jgi:hypothetical protein